MSNRNRQLTWLTTKACPQCRANSRLMPGPFYDMWKMRCLECGYCFRFIKPKELPG